MVQPPGMGMSPMPDMELHRWMVAAVLTAKTIAETPRRP